jgi:hypothetical protein
MTADQPTVKLLLNAVVSEDAKFMTADAKDFYLGSPMETPEYMWIKKDQIPDDIANTFKSSIIWRGDKAMVKIVRGIYGLPQAGKLAQDKLNRLLAKHGYHQMPNTPCLYRHDTRNITFTLVVDDFGVKYKDKDDVQHLLNAIREEYELTEDWEGAKYLGISIAFAGPPGHRTVSLSIPGYVEAALKRFGVQRPIKLTRSPAPYIMPEYGHQPQTPTADDTSQVLDPTRAKYIQEVIGVFLYYSRAVDPTMFTTLNKLASRQALPTEKLLSEVQHFLNYAASYPDAVITYYASNMELVVHSDGSYLSETKARSRAGGIHFLRRNDQPTLANGVVDVISSIIPAVVSSASEAEYAALFMNSQTACGIRSTLSDLGYPQPTTTIVCDNTTAVGIANRTTKVRKSKAIDMRFHWIRDRCDQGQFNIQWEPGSANLADYFTKTHPVSYYIEKRATYVNEPQDSGWTKVLSKNNKHRAKDVSLPTFPHNKH